MCVAGAYACPWPAPPEPQEGDDHARLAALHNRLGAAARAHLPQPLPSTAPLDLPPPTLVTALRLPPAPNPEAPPGTARGPQRGPSARWPVVVRVPVPDPARDPDAAARGQRAAVATAVVQGVMWVLLLCETWGLHVAL
jgi:hypothetical protein